MLRAAHKAFHYLSGSSSGRRLPGRELNRRPIGQTARALRLVYLSPTTADGRINLNVIVVLFVKRDRLVCFLEVRLLIRSDAHRNFHSCEVHGVFRHDKGICDRNGQGDRHLNLCWK